MTSDRLFYLFINYLEQLPSLLALVACIIFAITRWKRHGRVAMVVAVGLGLLLLHAIVFTCVYTFVPRYFIDYSRDYKEIETTIRNVYLVIGLISNTVAAVAFAVVLTGIFMHRKTPEGLQANSG